MKIRSLLVNSELGRMGAEQSKDGGVLRKTETANFDFRFEQPNKDESTKSSPNHASINKKTEHWSVEQKMMNTSGDGNSCWLEVGMDVVKRLDSQQNTFQAFYSR